MTNFQGMLKSKTKQSCVIKCYQFIMDGKQVIKIMSKVQLIATLKFSNTEDLKQKKVKKFSTRKRGSTPLISTSISTQRKNNNQSNTLRKVPANNFMTNTVNLMSLTSTKRLSQCHTVLAMRPMKREDNVQKSEAQKLLLKNSDKIHRLLWNQGNQNLPPIVVSADFIIDQDSFWCAPKINNNINKQWKDLHKNYFVIWIVKLQKSFKLLKEHCELNELPLNSIYYQKRQSRFTVDCIPLRKQINKIYGQNIAQVKYIQALKMNTKDVCESNSFLGRVPLMLDSRLKVCYLRCQESAQGLDKVLLISKNIPTLLEQRVIELKSIPVFIDNHYREIDQEKKDAGHGIRANTIFQRCQTQFIDEEEAERRVEDFKRRMIETVIKEKGRNFQHEGFSVHYFVGDIIKRNYDLLLKSAMSRTENKNKLNMKYINRNFRNEQKQVEIAQKFFQYYI